MAKELAELLFLGTASASPAPGRRLPGALLRIGDSYFLLDCGEGTQYSLMEAGERLTNKRLAVLVSHMHGDHVLGLPGLLLSLSLSGRTRELDLVGPRGLRGFVLGALRYTRAQVGFELRFQEAKGGLEAEVNGLRLRAALGRHSAPNYAYLIIARWPGKFHPERAMALGVPKGPLWKALQEGSSVVVGGRAVRPEEVMEPASVEVRIGYSGDTRPTRRLERFFAGADLLIYEATYSEADADRARENMHSTALEAASLAKRAGVKHLILTHFSNRYEDLGPLLEEARSAFPSVQLAGEGRRFRLTPEGLLPGD